MADNGIMLMHFFFLRTPISSYIFEQENIDMHHICGFLCNETNLGYPFLNKRAHVELCDLSNLCMQARA
jgi:hypothetical protein